MHWVIHIGGILRIQLLDESSFSVVTMDNRQSHVNPNHTVLVHKKGGQKTFRYIVFAKHVKRTNQQYS